MQRYAPEVQAGGLCVVAEDVSEGGLLAGAAILGSQPVQAHPELLQLLFFHISRPYRRQGIGGRLFAHIQAATHDRGAAGLYISATPTGSAVGFYGSRGAGLIDPDPALLRAEPEDVHLAVMFEHGGQT
ncbi:MAG: N-acetyltransferase [Chloroflexi bacterium]|nr:N-acetyltransferase [Chloroflexota bacterium]